MMKRVSGEHLPDDRPKSDIATLDTKSWMLSQDELTKYEEDLDFHSLQILIKYFSFLAPFKDIVP